MILTLNNLHHYLLEKGTLDAASITDGSYMASQSRTRNTTFNVTRRKGKNLFIKQLVYFDQQNNYILQKDATCLWLIKNEPAFARLSAFVPDYFGYDAENQVLITEFLQDARNMETFLRLENGQIANFAPRIAEILASFHFPLTEKLRNLPSMRFLEKQLPWIFKLGLPNSGVQPGNSPVMQTVENNPDFQAMLKDARAQYEFSTLIHGDIKWMNFLVHGNPGEENLKLIDWEIADIGDPIWDIAGVFMSIIMLSVAESPYQQKDMSSFPLNNPIEGMKDCWPLIRKCWLEYLTLRPITDSDSALKKALHFTGVRLIQTAVEFNMHIPEINPNANRLLLACIALFRHRDFILEQLAQNSIPVLA